MNQKCFVLIGKIDVITHILELLRKEFGDITVSELLEMEGKK